MLGIVIKVGLPAALMQEDESQTPLAASLKISRSFSLMPPRTSHGVSGSAAVIRTVGIKKAPVLVPEWTLQR